MLTIYSKDNCPGCRTALAMIKSKGLDHQVLKLGTDYTKADLDAVIPNVRTVPQIVDSETGVIGGVPELQKYLLNK